MVKEEKRQITCCFTGHRKIPPEQHKDIARRLKIEVINLVQQGYLYFGSGGALGFDTIAAQTVLDLKTEYPQIKLILVLPCKDQTRGWQDKDIKIYEYIKSRADKTVYTAEHYFRGCMQRRNRHLINNSASCIAYLAKKTGGTAYTVKYAKYRGLIVINIV